MANIQMHHVAESTLNRVALGLLLHESLREFVARAKLHGEFLRVVGIMDVQRQPEVVVLQVAIAVPVDHDATFATSGFGDENARSGQSRRMVLHEFHVLEWHARSIGQGHAVAGLDRPVGRKREDPPGAARTNDHRARRDAPHLTAEQLDGSDSPAAPVINQQTRCKPLVVTHDRWVFQRRLKQCVQHVEARLVGSEPSALLLHPAKRSNRHAPVRIATPRAAPMFKLNHLGRRFTDKDLDRVLVGQPVRSADRVIGVGVETVIISDDRCGATLCRHGVTAHGVDL